MTEDPADDQVGPHPFEELLDEPIPPSAPMEKWRRGTASGAFLSAVALGLKEVLEVPREAAPIEIEAPGEPPRGRRIETDLDPDDPAASVVHFRNWRT